MGLDRAAFKVLLQPFTRMYHKYTLKGDLITSKQASNANRALDPAGVLALVLHWLSSKVEEKYLCLIFCVSAASINKYKNFGLKLLQAILTKRKDCRVVWPTAEEQESLAALTNEKEPLLTGVWGFLDGLNLSIFNPSDVDTQNAYYNGWQHVTACSSIIVWRADGLIGYFAGNYPGSWHDGHIAGRGLYDKLATACTPPFCVAADSAFPQPKTCPGIMKVFKDTETAALNLTDDEVKVHEATQNALISVRQAAEWGMGTFQVKKTKFCTNLFLSCSEN